MGDLQYGGSVYAWLPEIAKAVANMFMKATDVPLRGGISLCLPCSLGETALLTAGYSPPCTT